MERKDLIDHYNSSRYDHDRKESPSIRIFKANNFIKSVLFTETRKKMEGPVSVLDLCAGQGSDITKWNHLNIKKYVGLDISPESVKRAQERIVRLKVPNCFFQVQDCAQPFQLHEKFDIVSIQFAIHYFFEKKEMLQTLLNSVSAHLNRGGYFLITTTDPMILRKRVKTQKLNNALYKIEMDQKTLDDILMCKKDFGIPYTFSLVDAVHHLPEYLPVPKLLIDYAYNHNLQFKFMTNCLEYYKKQKPLQRDLHYKIVGTDDLTSVDEEVVELYCIYVFQKTI